MSAGVVFPFKRAYKFSGPDHFYYRLFILRDVQRLFELFGVDPPVGPEFDLSGKPRHLGEDRVGVPAAFEVFGFGPGVGVEQAVFFYRPAPACRQPPDIDHIGAGQDQVVRKVDSLIPKPPVQAFF